MLTNLPLMQWAMIPFFQCWIHEPFKFNYSSEQFLICTDLQCACLTSVCSTNALKAKETVFLPHYSPESLIRIQILYAMKAGSGAQDGKIPWKSSKRQPAALEEEGLSHRVRASKSGFSNLTWYEQFSWCTISEHPRARTLKLNSWARLRRGSAEHPQAREGERPG